MITNQTLFTLRLISKVSSKDIKLTKNYMRPKIRLNKGSDGGSRYGLVSVYLSVCPPVGPSVCLPFEDAMTDYRGHVMVIVYNLHGLSF